MKLFLQTHLSKELIVFFISFSVLIGSSYNTHLAYERYINPDSETYMNTARLHFKDQSLVRRYRVIIPIAAGIISVPISKVYYKIVKENRDKYDWPLLTAFFLLNALIMSLACVMIYKIMQWQNISNIGSVIGLAAFLAGGRWSSFLTGHPVTDSLTILCIAMTVYSLLKPNNILLSLGIIIGLLSKESFLLFFPLIAIFVKKESRLTAVLSMLTSVVLYFLVKYIIDSVAHDSSILSLGEDVSHFQNIKLSLIKIFSVKGVADIFSTYGFFTLIPLSGLFFGIFRTFAKSYTDKFFITFSVIIFVHMILSYELARMLFLGSALFVPLIAKCFELNPLFKNLLPNAERAAVE